MGDGQVAVQGRKGGRAGEREREEAPAALRYRLHPVDSRASRAVARTVALGFGTQCHVLMLWQTCLVNCSGYHIDFYHFFYYRF